MATTTRSNGSTRKPAKVTASLCMAVDHTAFLVTPLSADDPNVIKAWDIAKQGGDRASYTIADTVHGPTCTCGDFTFRHEGTDGLCKHLTAAKMVGLLDAAPVPIASPAVKPAPVRCCSCHRPSVREADGMPWCSSCYDRVTAAPVACCSPAEPSPCLECSTPCTALDCLRNTCTGCLSDIGHGHEPLNRPVDLGTELLERGIALAEAEIAPNPLVTLVDHYPDEAPEGPTDLDFEEWKFFRDNPAALPAEPEPYEPSAEDEEAFHAFKLGSAARELLDRSGTMTLDALAEHVADWFKTWGNGAGDLFARTLEEIALKARLVDAKTPADYDARIESLELDVREQWEAAGYEAGRQAGCRCGDVVLA